VSGSPARRPAVEDLVDAYRNDLVAAGMFAGHPVTSVARMVFTRVGPGGWARLPLAAQCALPLKDRRVVGWLIVTGRPRPSPDYLGLAPPTSVRSPPVITVRSTSASPPPPPGSASTRS
jgi:hypothetical protein